MPCNTAAIRQLLIAAFDDEGITHLCYDDFRLVYEKFASGMGLSQKVQLLIEYCEKHDQLDKLLELVKQKNPKQYCKFAKKIDIERYYNLFGGEEILCLLWGLDSVPLVEDVKDYYQRAYDQRSDDPKTAIELCQKALLMLQDPSGRALGDLNLKYARGKCHLLIASIYLSQVEKYKRAEEHFDYSQREFHYWQWSHVESLAYLGLAVVQRKLKDFENALEACKNAHDCARHESIPRGIDTKELLEAIRHERITIQQLRVDLQPQKDEDISLGGLTEEPTPSIPHAEKPPQADERTEATEEPTPSIPHAEKPPQADERTEAAIERKVVPIFRTSAGKGLVTTRKAIDINLLSREDYEQNPSGRPRNVVLKRQSYLNKASYILEIDEGVTPNDGLETGDWLIIREEDDLNKLNGRKVAVLLEQESETSIHLRTCVKAEDHYLLKALNKDTVSFVVINYNVSLRRMQNIDTLYYDKKIIRRVDDIQVSGPIIRNERVPKESIGLRVDSFVWEIPLVKYIAAGLEQPIAEKNIVDYVKVELDENEPAVGNYFVVLVEGNSMTGDDISNGDAVLIHQQENVDKGDIAAVIIVPGGDAFLKRHHLVFEEHDNARHWRLESSNPGSEHLVVIPKGANARGIRDYYDKQRQAGKIHNPIKYYEGAGVRVAGKYIKKVNLPENFERS